MTLPRLQAPAPVRVSRPGDEREREADRAASQALDGAHGSAHVQRAASSGGGGGPMTAQPAFASRGEPLPEGTQQEFGARFGTDFSAVRVHRGAEMDALARGLEARAFALGNDIGFAAGEYDPQGRNGRRLLAHELAHVAQAGGRRDTLHRAPVHPTPVARRSRLDLLGDGTAAHRGTTLDDFEGYTRLQADWFVEPSLSAGDRRDLWALLLRATSVAPTLAGAGDLLLADLAGVSAADWNSLDAFCRACHGGSRTVHIASRASHPLLAERIALGATLLGLEALLPPAVLAITVNEAQLVDVHRNGWLPLIADYFARFSPHLQGSHTVSSGTPEFQNLLDLVSAPMGIVPYLSLRGRIRNLHRFSAAMRMRLVFNYLDVTRARPVQLVVHTGHDASAFQQSAPLFEDLVLNSPNLVLMIEGADSLNDISTAVPAIAARYGQRDAHGVPRIAQVMIAGHGSARSVGMAGTGVPHVTEGAVEYPSEDLDLDTNAGPTTRLLDTLFAHMDPRQARLVYAGCLVGSNPVPEGTPAAGVAGHITSHPSLGTFTESRARAAGMPAGTVSAARASVALGSATSLRDARGNLTINYGFDQAAFGPARGYVSVGMEPEGVLVAAVEVAAADGPVVAEGLLRARLARPVRATSWWDQCTRMVVELALDGVAAGAGIDIAHVNQLAHTAHIPFLDRWPGNYAISAAHFVNEVNPRGFAASLYAKLLATPAFQAPGDADVRAGRLIAEQGWVALDATRAGALITFLDATPTLTASEIAQRLNTGALALRSADLFPAAAAVTDGRVRLALAWLQNDPANADVRAFLDGQVLMPASGPELSAAVRGQLGGTTEREVLAALNRLTAMRPGVGGAPPRPDANADLIRSRARLNDIRIEPQVYVATVLPLGLNVRDRPGMHGRPFDVLRRGASVTVMGFAGSWAAIDHGGRLGFVYRTQVTTP